MIFIYGHPASGKTTLTKMLEKKLGNSFRCGNDTSRNTLKELPTVILKKELEIYRLTAKRTMDIIRSNTLPLVDVTFSTEIKRNTFFSDFQFENIPSLTIKINTPKEICRFRIQKRQKEEEGLKDILWFDNLIGETTTWNYGNHLTNYYSIEICAADYKWYSNNKPIEEINELAILHNKVLEIINANILSQ